jgi:hypothetical protein
VEEMGLNINLTFPGFLGTIFIVFLVLKLTHVISWSWWWVFSPLWLSLVVAVVLVMIFGVIYFIGQKMQ